MASKAMLKLMSVRRRGEQILPFADASISMLDMRQISGFFRNEPSGGGNDTSKSPRGWRGRTRPLMAVR